MALVHHGREFCPAPWTVLEGVVTANPRAGADEYATVVRTFAVLGDAAAARTWAARGHARFPADRRFQ